MQNCTLIVTGSCSAGPVGAGSYFEKIHAGGAGTNVAHLLPQGSLRSQVMGKENREPTVAELDEMRELDDQAMQDGVFEMSTGLIDIPSIFTLTGELIEFAEVVAKHKGIYACRIREPSVPFPRKLDYYASRENVITQEHAIRSATSLPVEILGLTDRGRIKPAMVADVAVFDPKTIRDRATFTQPSLQSTGIHHVLVNGQLAVHDGIPTGRLAGRAVRKPQFDRTN